MPQFKSYYSIESIILYIILSFNYSNASSESLLSLTCNRQKFPNGCPSHLNTYCNRRNGYCQCKPEYHLLISPLTPCLKYQDLEEECFHSLQCNKTLNAVCYDSKLNPLNDIEPLKQWFIEGMTARHNKYKPNINNGRCQCEVGYVSTFNNKCQRAHVSELICEGSYQCMNWDLNSHCDRRTKRCTCDAGYSYDTDLVKCQISAKKFADSCILNLECRSWDINMDCQTSICICRNSYQYDSVTQRCKHIPDFKKCRPGYAWDELTSGCHSIHANELHNPVVKDVTPDKMLELVTVLLFFVIIVFMLRYWRSLLPTTYNSYYGSFGIFSDLNHRNVNRTRSRNSLGSPRVIHLRVNLDSPVHHFTNDETNLDLNSSLFPSTSSLPPYESSAEDCNAVPLPPYTDEPPTYEEAVAFVKFKCCSPKLCIFENSNL